MKPNYKFQKQQRDLAKKKKKEAKRQRKLARKNIKPPNGDASQPEENKEQDGKTY